MSIVLHQSWSVYVHFSISYFFLHHQTAAGAEVLSGVDLWVHPRGLVKNQASIIITTASRFAHVLHIYITQSDKHSGFFFPLAG